MKKNNLFNVILFSVIGTFFLSYGELDPLQLQVDTSYLSGSLEASSSTDFDVDPSGFLIGVNLGPKSGSFVEVFGIYTTGDEGSLAAPVNLTLPGDFTSIGVYGGVGYRYPLSDKIDYKISGGLGLNNLDAKGLNLLGNPTVDDSGTALVMYWQTSLSYQINNKYSISLAYQYLGENDETTWTTGEKIDYSLSTVGFGIHRTL